MLCVHTTAREIHILTQTMREARAKQCEHKNMTDDKSTRDCMQWKVNSHLITPYLQLQCKLSNISLSADNQLQLEGNNPDYIHIPTLKILLKPSILPHLSSSKKIDHDSKKFSRLL